MIRELPCKRCGYQIWLAPASREFLTVTRSSGRMVILDAFEDTPGRGSLSVGRGGKIVIDDKTGTLVKHGCPAYVFSCKYCGELIIRLMAPPEHRGERMMILDARPNPYGTVVLGERGYAVHDPVFAIEGTRYYWHTKHEGRRS